MSTNLLHRDHTVLGDQVLGDRSSGGIDADWNGDDNHPVRRFDTSPDFLKRKQKVFWSCRDLDRKLRDVGLVELDSLR